MLLWLILAFVVGLGVGAGLAILGFFIFWHDEMLE